MDNKDHRGIIKILSESFPDMDRLDIEKISKLFNFKNSFDKKKLEDICSYFKKNFEKSDYCILFGILLAIYLESDFIKWESAKNKIGELANKVKIDKGGLVNKALSIFKKQEVHPEDDEKDYADMYINIGKDKKVFPNNLLQFICSNMNIKPSQIKNIRIFESYSFFKVPKELQDKVIISLSVKKFRGKSIIVNLGKKQG
ncbi:MAG: DbpA RNA binding domain-containing protein [Spirochaetes bacterium]|nr:DbpA RNA binding domain-containing protein [Spirochaetota bacterium]